MSIDVRPYRPEDRDALVALALRAWEPVFASVRSVLAGSGVFERLYPDGWAAAQRGAVTEVCATSPVWVAEVDGALAGYAAARLHTGQRMGELTMLAVDPAWQRRGVGSRLTGCALDWMRAEGMTTAVVETGGDPGHAPARATYRRAGFTPLPISRGFRTL